MDSVTVTQAIPSPLGQERSDKQKERSKTPPHVVLNQQVSAVNRAGATNDQQCSAKNAQR